MSRIDDSHSNRNSALKKIKQFEMMLLLVLILFIQEHLSKRIPYLQKYTISSVKIQKEKHTDYNFSSSLVASSYL